MSCTWNRKEGDAKQKVEEGTKIERCLLRSAKKAEKSCFSLALEMGIKGRALSDQRYDKVEAKRGKEVKGTSGAGGSKQRDRLTIAQIG